MAAVCRNSVCGRTAQSENVEPSRYSVKDNFPPPGQGSGSVAARLLKAVLGSQPQPQPVPPLQQTMVKADPDVSHP
ncbi:hypothetical protein ACOMHN_051830 [Nucella lapillus]